MGLMCRPSMKVYISSVSFLIGRASATSAWTATQRHCAVWLPNSRVRPLALILPMRCGWTVNVCRTARCRVPRSTFQIFNQLRRSPVEQRNSPASRVWMYKPTGIAAARYFPFRAWWLTWLAIWYALIPFLRRSFHIIAYLRVGISLRTPCRDIQFFKYLAASFYIATFTILVQNWTIRN